MARRQRPTRATNLVELRERRGAQEEPTYVDLSDNLTVGVRVRSMEALIALDAIPNNLMNVALSMGRKKPEERTTEDFRQTVELQDLICSLVIVDPPYATLPEVRQNDGQPPEGKLYLGYLTTEEINAVFSLVYQGLEAWESFREELRRSTADADGGEVGSEAEPAPSGGEPPVPLYPDTAREAAPA